MRNFILMSLSIALLTACSGGEPGRPDDAVVQGVHYIGVTVSDIEQSEAFYEKVGNLKKIDNAELNDQSLIEHLAGKTGLEMSTSVIKGVNAQLRLMQFDNPTMAAKNADPVKVYGPGIAHLAFQVNETTDAYPTFLKEGGRHIGAVEMWKNPKTQVSYAYGYDRDNIIVEIEHVDVAALNLEVPPKNNHRIRQIALSTPDIDRAVDFYSHLLQEAHPRRTGWFNMSGDAVDMVTGEKGSELRFAWFQVRNLELEIIEYVSHPTDVPKEPRPIDALGYNLVMFDVTDLNAVRERLLAAGGTVVSEGRELDGVPVLLARDLDGNLLGFQKLPDESPLSSQNFSGNGL